MIRARAAQSGTVPASTILACLLLAMLVATLSGLAACSDSPTSPAAGLPPSEAELPDSQLAELIVSNAQPPRVSIQHAAGTAMSGSTMPVVYVSLPPGTLPHMRSVRVRNVTSGTTSPVIPLVDGGFDPFTVPAEPGQQLTLEFAAASGGFRVLNIIVAARRPPRVVRVVPPRGRTDVALSIWPSVVFNEPVDPATLAGSVRLLAGNTVVSGRVSVIPAAPWSVEFAPDAPLVPGFTYTLEISGGVRDLDGDRLEEPLTSTFSTEAPTGESPGRLYHRVSPWSFSGTSEIMLRDDGTFSFQFNHVKFRFDWTRRPLTYTGAHSTTGDVVSLQFNASSNGQPWQATAIRRGDSLIVEYNGAMSTATLPARALFENGVYLLSGSAEPPLPPLPGKLAFVRDHDGLPYIHVTSGDLSNDTRLVQGDLPTWSPDGRVLLFTRPASDGSGASAHFCCPNEGRWSSLHRIDADGSNERRLAYGAEGAWSPSGSEIVFSGSEGIAIMQADGTGVRTLIRHDSGYPWRTWMGAPAWSPNGSRIAFIFHEEPTLFTMNAFDGSGVSPFWGAGFAEDREFWPAWAPDGSEIMLGSSDFGIALIVPNGTKRSIHWDPLHFIARPAWALGGTWIIFDKPRWSAQARRYDSNLYMLRRTGGIPQLLLQDARSPAWTTHE